LPLGTAPGSFGIAVDIEFAWVEKFDPWLLSLLVVADDSRSSSVVAPYKLTPVCREVVLVGLRDGLTLREATAAAGVTSSGVSKFCGRGSREGAAFAEELERAKREGLPRRASRVRKGTAALRSGSDAPAPDQRPFVEIAGMQVTRVRQTVELFEAAFVLGVSLTRLRALIRRRQDDHSDRLGLGSVRGPGNRRLVAAEALREHPLVVNEPLALVLLARLVEGRLQVSRPDSDSAVPEDHIVALRGVL
jgi:hypothetical protein